MHLCMTHSCILTLWSFMKAHTATAVLLKLMLSDRCGALLRTGRMIAARTCDRHSNASLTERYAAEKVCLLCQ